ncbi:MAG: hypothetical protein J6A96_00920 [Clostridia bacterium]|nr:hypothetical protein [Clostridia bacterium]
MKKSDIDRILGRSAKEKENTSRRDDDLNAASRVGLTALDVIGNVGKGAVKTLEGIYDEGATLVGAVGGIFDSDFKDDVAEHIKYDATDKVFDSMGFDYVEDNSYLEGNKVGEFTRGVSSGIGGMLPSVALGFIPGAGPVLAPVSMGVGAAGQATESALNKGAGYYGSAAYGVGMGLVEGATEALGGYMLGGGNSLIGKVLAGTKLGKFTSKGIGKVAETFISEGSEEVITDYADVGMQFVTGVDKDWRKNLDEANKGAFNTFATGGTVGSFMQGGNVTMNALRNRNRGGFKATRADESFNYIKEVSKNYGEGKSNAKYDNAIEGALHDISRELTSMSPEARKNYMAEMGAFKNAFNAEDGSIKMDLRANINEGAVSNGLRGISGVLAHKPVSYDTEISEGASKAKTVVEKLLGEGANVVITSDSVENNAFYNIDEGIVYINNNAEFKGEEIAEFVATHEVAHITEGTKEYLSLNKVLEEIATDQRAPSVLKSKIGNIAKRQIEIGELYKEQMANMTPEQQAYLIRTELNADLVGTLLGDDYFIEKLAQRDASLVKKIFNHLKGLTKKSTTIDKGSAKYLNKLVGKFGKAIDKSQGGVKISQLGREDEETEQSEVENVRFSKKMVPGTNEKFVVIEKTSIEKLTSFPGETLSAKVRNYLKQFRGTVLPLGSTDKTYMRREAEGEYTNPAKVVSETDYEGKLNAASEFENLLESAKFVDHQPDNGRHPDATRGWNYYELKYVVPTNDGVRAYKGQIQIKLIDRGDCFYDITKIEDITNGAAGQALIKAAGSADISSNNSISENSEKINTFDKKIDDERKSISKSSKNDFVFEAAENGGVRVSIPNPELEKMQKRMDSEKARKESFDALIENDPDTQRHRASEQARKESEESLLNGEEGKLKTETRYENDNATDKERFEKAERERKESEEEYTSRKVGYIGKGKVRQLIFDAIDGAGILENVGEDIAFLTKDAKKDIISTVFSKVNSPYKYNKKDFSNYIAQKIMESVILGEGKVLKANARLKKIMHKIEISSVEERISKNDKLKITSRWKVRDGNDAISIADATKELNDLGYQIPMTDELDMLNEINRVYENTREYVEKEMGEELSKRIGKEEYEKAKNKLANDTLTILEENQTDDELASKLADVINKHQKTLDRFHNYRQNFRVDENRIRAEMTIVHHAKQIKTDIKNHKYTPAQQPRFEEFKGVISKIAKLEVRGNINRSSTKEIVDDLNLWYTKENELLVDSFSESIREDITYFRDDNSGEKVLTINELNRLSRILAHLKNVFVNFGKIYRAGKWIELSEVSHKMYKVCSEAVDSQTTLQRLFNRGQYFESPLAVASILDGHDPDGEFTRYVEDLQRGQLNVATEKMKIAEKLEEFFKKDKKLFDSLVSGKLKAKCGMKIDLRNEIVEQVEIPAVNLVNLYLCTRTMSPEDFTLENVGYAVKVDNSGEYTYMYPISREEIKKAYETLPVPVKELAMWILEWNNTEGKKMKYEQDIRVNGVSNVISGDYWHLKRRHFEGTNDMKKLFGSRGIGNHGFNKERIKQASSMLIIDNFIEAFLNHTEELFQYKYIDITIKNFDKIVQANVNVNATGNKGFKSVKMLIEEQRFYHGTISKDKTALDYTTQLALDVLKQNVQSDAFNIIIGNMRAGYASYVLGINPKVLATQFSSLIAGFGELNAASVLHGGANIIKILNHVALKNLAKEVDSYCDWAKVRHFEKGATKAMTLTDKWNKWRDVFSKPIELFDRLIVMLEFEACKKEAQSRYGLKIGTEENKVKAGELLTEIGLKTQQNQYESTKSAAIRSKNEIMKGFTMFKTDSHMILSGLIRNISAWSVLEKKIKSAKEAGGTTKVAELEKLRNQARKKVGKYTTVVILSCAYMTLLARLFNKLYHQDEDDEMTVGDIMLDLFGNFLGMFPIASEIGSFLIDGYDVGNSIYSTFNNALGAVDGSIELFQNAVNGKKIENEKLVSTLRNVVYAAGQMFGVPARNIYKNTKALIDIVSPSFGDRVDSWFKEPSQKELEKKIEAGIEKGDDKAVSTSLSLLYDKYDLELKDNVLRQEYDRLMRLEMTKGEDDETKYSPLEAEIPDSIKIDDEEVEMERKDVNVFKNAFGEAEKSQAKIVKTVTYKKLNDEQRAYALRKISQYYYENTRYTYTGEKSNFAYYAKVVGVESLALILAYAKGLKGDARLSRREKIEAYIKSLRLNSMQTSLALRCLGYGDKENDKQVISYVKRCYLLTQNERAELVKVLE